MATATVLEQMVLAKGLDRSAADVECAAAASRLSMSKEGEERMGRTGSNAGVTEVRVHFVFWLIRSSNQVNVVVV